MALLKFGMLLISTLLMHVQAKCPDQFRACGRACYVPDQYTCYTGNFLCPYIGGEPTFPCASACYLPSQYSCSNGSLGAPTTSNTFTITISAPKEPEDGMMLQASSFSFMVGPTITRPSTYCPTSVVPNGTCPAGTQTVFANGGSALDVEVPGGQQVYIAPSGLLTYTRAHSSSYPPGSQFGGFGALDGEYVITSPAGQGWLACPSSQVAQAYQIYADRAGHPDGCTDITLLLHSYTGPFAAWQYT